MNLSKQVANQKIRLCFTTSSSLASIYTASVFSQSTLRRRGRWTRNTGTWARPHRSPWPIYIYIPKDYPSWQITPQSLFPRVPSHALPRLRQVTTILGVKSLELASIVTTHLVQAKDGKNVDVFFLPGNFGNPYVLKVKTRKNPWFPVHFPYTNPLIVDTVIVLTIKMTVPWSMFKSSRYQPCSSNKAIEPPRNGGFNRKIIYRSGCLSPLMNVHRNESGFNGWAVHPMGQQHRAS